MTVMLEVGCGRCEEWWMRWTVDPDRPLDDQEPMTAVNGSGVVRTQSPGSYVPATDGQWYRWTPGRTASIPEGGTYGIYRFTCPNGCETDPQARVKRLHRAARVVLKGLCDTRTPKLRMTVDKLLTFSP